MGQYVRWQAIIAFAGAVLLIAYLNSIAIIKTTVIVPAEGGIYREGVVGAVQYLNPLLAEYNPLDQDVSSLIFEGLTRENGLGNLEPVLANTWSVSADGRVVVFALRQDVKWSDGVPFTSDDVIFTLDLIRSPEFPGNAAWQSAWQSVKIEKVDDYTLRFTLDEPFPSFLHYTTFGILPQHILKGVSARQLLTHPFNLSPIGTGPFKLQEATNRRLLLTRNPRYTGQPSRITQLEFKFYPDAEALYRAFSRREIDGLGQFTPDTLARLESAGDAQFFSGVLPRQGIVYLNLQQAEALPFFQDAVLRRALLMLVDRQAMIDAAMGGRAISANGPFLPWSWANNPSQPYPAYNPAQAIEILDAAGWLDSDGDGIRDKDGQPFAFTLLVSNNPVQRRVAENLAEQWQKAEIAVSVQSSDDELAQLKARQFEAALIEVELPGDPDPYRFWHQTQIEDGQNFAGWDNIPASEALEAGRTALEQDQRIAPYYTFQQIFAEELPSLVLYHPVYTYAAQDTLKNVQLPLLTTPADRFKTIKDWYLLTRRVIESTIGEQFLKDE
ncbi:MAG TPA: peptide ABC transporter substrate-binding protein [Chloroflexi bacterium]|nr:MAG: hypothetical protein B6243_09520 [Anaerolineaceae bacterium 4572_5.2]HEY83771.1 peptide ABC transporter substrate-binding protein [Chloroflexota bacterium]